MLASELQRGGREREERGGGTNPGEAADPDSEDDSDGMAIMAMAGRGPGAERTAVQGSTADNAEQQP